MAKEYARHPQVRVLATCDVEAERRAFQAHNVNEVTGNKDCKEYLDYREILKRNDIDAVLIGTPDHWHAIQAIDAAKAGKHIYCEKPVSHTILESQRMVEAVRKHKVVFQTGSQQRSEFGHRFVDAAERVRNGLIGESNTALVGVGGPSRPCSLPAESLEPGLDWDRWLGPAPQRPFNKTLCPRGVGYSHWPAWRYYSEYAGGGLATWVPITLTSPSGHSTKTAPARYV